MINWQNVDSNDLLYFNAVKFFLSDSPALLEHVFDPKKPQLRSSSKNLLDEANVFSSTEQLLIKMVIDLWTGSGNTGLAESCSKLGIHKVLCFCQAFKKIHG